MNNLELLTKRIILKTIATGTSILLAMGVSVVLNRYYGKSEYALLVLVYTVTGVCFIISDLGTKRTLNRYLPRYSSLNDKKALADLINTSILLQSLGIVLFALIIYFFAKPISLFIFGKPELILLIKAGALFFMGLSTAEFLSLLFQSLQTWWRDAVVSILYPLFYFGFVCLFSFGLHLPLKFSLYANALSSLIVLIIAVFIFPKSIKAIFLKNFNSESLSNSIKTIFVFGLPLVFHGFLFYLQSSFDRIIMGRFQPNEALTLYYISFLFVYGFMVLFSVLSAVFMPYLAELSILSHEQIKKKFALIFRWFLHFTMLISIGMFFLIEPLIKTLYGSNYEPCILIFRLFLIVFILRTVSLPQGMFLMNVFGKSKQTLYLNLALVGTQVILDIILIPRYSYFGAIAAAMASYTIYWIAMHSLIREIRQIFPKKKFVKSFFIFAAIVLISISFTFLRVENPFLLGFGMPILYLALLKLFHGIEARDLELTKEIYKFLSIKSDLKRKLSSEGSNL